MGTLSTVHAEKIIFDYESVNALPSLSARKPTLGPELDMVNEFVDKTISSLFATSTKSGTALFFEPSIDSGYPDIVIAVYDSSCAANWRAVRAMLHEDDLKILAFTMNHRSVDQESVTSTLGFSKRQIESSLELLHDCGMVVRYNKTWRSSKRSSFFSLKRLISIEAKIGNHKSALRQALYNCRFASESYVLLPSSSITPSVKRESVEWGIGILTDSEKGIATKAFRTDIPLNHVSLQFNEWVCRELAVREEICN